MFKRTVILDDKGNVLVNTDDPLPAILPPASRIVKDGKRPALDIRKIPITYLESGPLWIITPKEEGA